MPLILTNIVAATLLMESGGEGISGMQAVHEVILNRSALYHIPPAQVCLQPHQFSCWNGKSIFQGLAIANRNWPDVSKKIALTIVGTRRTYFLKGATHYHATTMKHFPAWTEKMEFIDTIGNHNFYRDKLHK